MAQDHKDQQQPEEPVFESREEVEAQEAEATDTEATAEGEGGRIEELEAQLAEAKDQAMRSAAEAQNSRRRAQQDVDKARKFAVEKFVKEMLPVADSLEKALETMRSEGIDDVHLEGVQMTLDMQRSAFEKAGVEMMDPQGEPFDPQFHEAMTMVPNPDVEPNTVIDVMQKGYLLNGRVVRPAMVVVSKAP